MHASLTQAETIELLARFGIDVAAVLLLLYGLYYRRHHDKELVTTAALFNTFVFAVLTILSSVEVSVAAGFGLFAILALFTLRSEKISKLEISYFFGSVAIAVICAVHGTTIGFVAVVIGCVLVGAYILDHPRILRSVKKIKLTLDKIEARVLFDQPTMRAGLVERLGVDVMYYKVKSFDYVKHTARVNVYYRQH